MSLRKLAHFAAFSFSWRGWLGFFLVDSFAKTVTETEEERRQDILESWCEETPMSEE